MLMFLLRHVSLRGVAVHIHMNRESTLRKWRHRNRHLSPFGPFCQCYAFEDKILKRSQVLGTCIKLPALIMEPNSSTFLTSPQNCPSSHTPPSPTPTECLRMHSRYVSSREHKNDGSHTRHYNSHYELHRC